MVGRCLRLPSLHSCVFVCLLVGLFVSCALCCVVLVWFGLVLVLSFLFVLLLFWGGLHVDRTLDGELLFLVLNITQKLAGLINIPWPPNDHG